MNKTILSLIVATAAGMPAMLAAGAQTSTNLIRINTNQVSKTNVVGNTNGTSRTPTVVTNSNPSGNLTRADAHFLAVAAIDSLHEIAIGFLAQTNSTNADVQAFGAKLVADHTDAYNAAVDLANSNNVTLPAKETRVQLAQDERLARLSGRQFDVAFDNIMISSHQQEISLFESEAIRAHDAGVRAYARSQLPVLMDHFVTALDIREELRASSSP